NKATSSTTSDEGGRRRIGIVEGEQHRISRFFLFFSLFFLLPKLIPSNSEQRRLKS
ncbi:unnamed protein product, partial [Musa textilis]